MSVTKSPPSFQHEGKLRTRRSIETHAHDKGKSSWPWCGSVNAEEYPSNRFLVVLHADYEFYKQIDKLRSFRNFRKNLRLSSDIALDELCRYLLRSNLDARSVPSTTTYYTFIELLCIACTNNGQNYDINHTMLLKHHFISEFSNIYICVLCTVRGFDVVSKKQFPKKFRHQLETILVYKSNSRNRLSLKDQITNNL